MEQVKIEQDQIQIEARWYDWAWKRLGLISSVTLKEGTSRIRHLWNSFFFWIRTKSRMHPHAPEFLSLCPPNFTSLSWEKNCIQKHILFHMDLGNGRIPIGIGGAVSALVPPLSQFNHGVWPKVRSIPAFSWVASFLLTLLTLLGVWGDRIWYISVSGVVYKLRSFSKRKTKRNAPVSRTLLCLLPSSLARLTRSEY